MNSESNVLRPDGCPICRSSDAVQIEFDRPVVLLCECSHCRKFIIKKKTLKELELEKDFIGNRKRISGFVSNYFLRIRKPLEIILTSEQALTKNQMTLPEVIEKINPN